MHVHALGRKRYLGRDGSEMALSFNRFCGIYRRLVCDESVDCVLCLCMVFYMFAAQFTVQPVSVVQAQGIDAVFECQYPGARTYIWGLNGEFPSHNSLPPDVTVTPPSGDIPTKLIIATGQHNIIVVQCVALVVRAGRVFIPELSVNATLQVQGSHKH